MQYRFVEDEGITAAVVHKQKVLLIRRVKIPFISNPGIWTFVQGKKKKGETDIETAHREIQEETGIGQENLALFHKGDREVLFDAVKKNVSWPNAFLIFHSKTPKVRINYESTGFRWAEFKELEAETDYTNIFIEKDKILHKIRSAIYAEKFNQE
ncbi:MAG: NUDIX domain-containing protein [Candidatus Micrarchaeota archaeon]|nr:NUDIX domain-containing protein [Candidatus Micrarchaeota archaeon]